MAGRRKSAQHLSVTAPLSGAELLTPFRVFQSLARETHTKPTMKTESEFQKPLLKIAPHNSTSIHKRKCWTLDTRQEVHKGV